jgi:hypothetical protein
VVTAGVRRFLPAALALALVLALLLGVAGVGLYRRQSDAAAQPPAPPARPTRVLKATVLLGFPGATGWVEQPACSGDETQPSCAAEWHHGDSGQTVQVHVLPLLDEGALPKTVQRLRAQVIPQGGVVDEVEQNGQHIVRFLQPLPGTDSALISVNYLLPAPDKTSMQLVTSVVPITEQVTGDGRVRDLLSFAAWLDAT